jgi:putative DNA primase/helicase
MPKTSTDLDLSWESEQARRLALPPPSPPPEPEAPPSDDKRSEARRTRESTLERLRREAMLTPYKQGQLRKLGAWPRRSTDLGNAGRLIRGFGPDLRYCTALKSWMYWEGGVWTADTTQRIYEYARRTIEGIWEDARDMRFDKEHRQALAKWAASSERRGSIESMIALAQHESGVPISTADLDTNDWIFVVPNGTLDLADEAWRSGCGPLPLRPHERRHLSTQSSPVEYDPHAGCPRWLEFLDVVLGDQQGSARPDLVRFVQKAVGYTLTGSCREHCLFILHGTGRNGKSTFLETLRAVIGTYSRSSQFTTFLEQPHNAGPRNDLARLRGARFVTAIETDHSKKLAESVIKQITSDDTITARFLYKEPFEFRPKLKLWLAANHLPQIVGVDEGIWRRIRTVPFDVRIPDDQVDRSLSAKLRAEYPGILKWALEGCRMWLRDGGLEPPASVVEAIQDYKRWMDRIGEFLETECLIGAEHSCSSRALYRRYHEYCEESKCRPLSKNVFSMRLLERDLKTEKLDKVKRRGVIWWKGIGLGDRSRDTAL